MSSFVVEFEVLPPKSDTDPSAQQVISELKSQLDKPDSQLRRNGEFARFASQASLEPGPGFGGWDGGGVTDGIGSVGGGSAGFGGGGFEVDLGESAPPPPPPAARSDSGHPATETVYTAPGASMPAGHGAPFSSGWSQPGPYDAPPDASRYGGGADWQGGGGVHSGLSNTELVDRITSLERQLQQTAAGGGAAGASMPPASQGAGFGGGGYDTPMSERLQAMERQLREEQEAARHFRHRSEQSELKLKDREQLLVHAKEMWMKENVRASKLADALTSAEDRLADQERRLAEVGERFGESQREVRQLQHLVGGAASNGFVDPDGPAAKGVRSGPLDWEGKVPASGGSLPQTRSTGISGGAVPESGYSLGTTAFDNSLNSGRARPSSGPADEFSRPLAVLPLDAETNSDRFRRLCQLNDAILYEDDLVQIGVKAEYNGKDGQVAVFFGNKATAALQSFTVQYFVREEHALRLAASPISQVLEADKQVVQRVSVTCLEPFVEPPWLRVQFLLPDTTPRRIQLKFPVVLTKFMVGRELTPQEFFQHWRQQNFVLNEVTAIVHIAARLRSALMNVARSIVFGGNLRMHHGIDNNPDNFVLVGQLVERPTPSEDRQGGDRSWDVFGLGGDHERGLSLIRVEVGSGRFTGKARVVVRSSDHTVARSLCNAIVAQLSEPNAPHSDGAVAR